MNDFTDGPLHATLTKFLPLYVKEPFSSDPKLNIPELKTALGMSHETVYKWLRTNKLLARNVTKLVDLANTADNLMVLGKLDRTAPTNKDFTQFLFD